MLFSFLKTGRRYWKDCRVYLKHKSKKKFKRREYLQCKNKPLKEQGKRKRRPVVLGNNWHLTNASHPRKFCKNNCAILELKKSKHSWVSTPSILYSLFLSEEIQWLELAFPNKLILFQGNVIFHVRTPV